MGGRSEFSPPFTGPASSRPPQLHRGTTALWYHICSAWSERSPFSGQSSAAQLSRTQGPGEVCQATGPETSLFSPVAGYTVTSVVSSRQGRVYVAGAPRFNHTGKVILFTMHNNRSLTIHQALQGEQVTQGRLGAGQTGGTEGKVGLEGTAAQLFPLRTVHRPTNVLPGWGYTPPSHPP